MSGQKCKVCGESSVLQEQEGAVCVNCGTVHSEQTFFSEDTIVGYQNPVYAHLNHPVHARQLSGKREQFLVKQCKAKMRILCAKLAFSSQMTEAVELLFTQAYKYDEFKRMHTYNKYMLSHCCVYVTGRQFDFPVTIKEFCVITRQSVSDIAKLYHRLVTQLQIDIQYQGIASLITYHLSDSIFSRECVDMVKDILKLYERKRTSSSPHRDVTIGIAAFLAWGSMNLVEYSTCTLKVFAKKHKFIFTPIWRVRLKELTEILSNIGGRLPWITNITSKNFVVNHLKDILQFQNSLLLKDVLEDESDEEEDEKDECDNKDEEDECDNKDEEDKHDHECMYMYEVDNDDTCLTDHQAENENVNGQNTLNQSESVHVEVDPVNTKRLNYSDLAGKTFVYHSTFRVITADLDSSTK